MEVLYLYIVFIFSGLTHYIYCSTSISTIILRVLIILLFTFIVIIVNFVVFFLLLLLLPLLFYFIYLFHLIFICLKIYLLIRRPIRPEGSPFGRLFNPEMLRNKELVSTQTYVCNPSIQPSRECLVINWMANSRYGPCHP